MGMCCAGIVIMVNFFLTYVVPYLSNVKNLTLKVRITVFMMTFVLTQMDHG